MNTTKIAELTEIRLTGFMSAYLVLRVLRTVLKNKTWQTIFIEILILIIISQTEDQSSRFCLPCSNKVRSTRAEFSVIKTSFHERENGDNGF